MPIRTRTYPWKLTRVHQVRTLRTLNTGRMWSGRGSIHCWWGREMGCTLGAILVASCKTKHTLNYVAAIVLFCMYLKDNKTLVQRKPCTRCLLSFIHICQNLERTKKSFPREWLINCVHPDNGQWNVTAIWKKYWRVRWKCKEEMPEEHNWQGDVRSVKVAREDWGS